VVAALAAIVPVGTGPKTVADILAVASRGITRTLGKRSDLGLRRDLVLRA
jgi:hypothetical protein